MDITSIEVPVAIGVCILSVLTSFGIHRYKARFGGTAPPIHESAVACVAGLILGGIIRLTTGQSVSFDSHLFFYLVLPPIIFSAGFGVKRKKFFRNLPSIALLGIAGTLINLLLVAAAAYAFSYFELFPGGGDASNFNSGLDNGGGVGSGVGVGVGVGSSSNVGSGATVRLTWLQACLLSAVLSASDEVSALSLVRMSEVPKVRGGGMGRGRLGGSLNLHTFPIFPTFPILVSYFLCYYIIYIMPTLPYLSPFSLTSPDAYR